MRDAGQGAPYEQVRRHVDDGERELVVEEALASEQAAGHAQGHACGADGAAQGPQEPAPPDRDRGGRGEIF